MKIIDYNILEETSSFQLTQMVKTYIGLGFQPKDNLMVIKGSYDIKYIQLMVKYDPEEEAAAERTTVGRNIGV